MPAALTDAALRHRTRTRHHRIAIAATVAAALIAAAALALLGLTTLGFVLERAHPTGASYICWTEPADATGPAERICGSDATKAPANAYGFATLDPHTPMSFAPNAGAQ